MADSVVSACSSHLEKGSPFKPIVDPGMSSKEAILRIGTNVYGADNVDLSDSAHKSIEKFKKWGFGNLPVCMAKTQYSFSHDKKVLGAPVGFTLQVREARLNAGAGFIVAICGSMMTLPGLPSRPAAMDMDMDEAMSMCMAVDMAMAGGFERPILHGLCSLGYATRHVLDACADGDPARFKAVRARFSSPVLPGDTLVTRMWKVGRGRIAFVTVVERTGKPAITNAYVDLADAPPASSL